MSSLRRQGNEKRRKKGEPATPSPAYHLAPIAYRCLARLPTTDLPPQRAPRTHRGLGLRPSAATRTSSDRKCIISCCVSRRYERSETKSSTESNVSQDCSTKYEDSREYDLPFVASCLCVSQVWFRPRAQPEAGLGNLWIP